MTAKDAWLSQFINDAQRIAAGRTPVSFARTELERAESAKLRNECSDGTYAINGQMEADAAYIKMCRQRVEELEKGAG